MVIKNIRSIWTDLKYERMMHQKKLALATNAVRTCGGAYRKFMICTSGQNMQPVYAKQQIHSTFIQVT